MRIERWIVMRMHGAVRWQVETYHAHQKPVTERFDSVQLAATFLAKGAPVSIEGPSTLELGEYAIIRIERGDS